MLKRLRPFWIPAATFVLAVSLKNDFVRFLLGFELLLYLAAFLEVSWMAKKLSLHADLPEKIVFRGEEFVIRGRLSSRFVLPVPRMEARLSVRALPEQEELLLKGRIMLDAEEEGFLCFALDSAYCGCLELRPDRLTVYDHLGIFHRNCPVAREEKQLLYILPEFLRKDVPLPDVKGALSSEDGSDSIRGSAAVDVSDIRPYQIGDSLRLVHWKLSARMNELMVRDMADPVEQMPWLYLNLREPEDRADHAARKDRTQWDHFIDTAAGASASLLEMEAAHMVFWVDASGGTLEKFRVSDETELQNMLCALLRADTFTSRDYAEILEEIRSDETKAECIEINIQGVLSRWEE